jgi:hypothetical protein
MLATVFSHARGWISDCASTLVCARKRSTIPRTNGRMAAEVTSIRRLAFARRLLEFLAHQIDELGELGWLHGEIAVVALADDRFRERLLPSGGERDDRQVLSHGNLTSSALLFLAEGCFPRDAAYLHAAPMFHLANGAAMYCMLLNAGTNAIIKAFSPDAVAGSDKCGHGNLC